MSSRVVFANQTVILAARIMPVKCARTQAKQYNKQIASWPPTIVLIQPHFTLHVPDLRIHVSITTFLHTSHLEPPACRRVTHKFVAK
jgi:hypothetical protein